jgi:hypothetical protein
VLYRIGLDGERFDMQATLRDLGTGVMWRPRGDSNSGTTVKGL